MKDLTDEQLIRYNRHLTLSEVGLEGQKKIMEGKVLIVGAGGLGSPVALYLAAAGVGTIGIVDADVVDLSNLQRQVIHSMDKLDTPKVDSAKYRMNSINPEVKVFTYPIFLDQSNAPEIIKKYDFIVDCTDNFEVKYLINDVCVKLNKPFSHGGILHFTGQTFTHLPGTACYRCLFKEPPLADSVPQKPGIFGAIAGMLGSIQAAEVLKFLTGTGELLTNRLLMFDAKSMMFQTLKFARNCNCPACSDVNQ